MNALRNILITGDLVLDHHLYEGTCPNPYQDHERGLTSLVEWGGADLLRRLLNEIERQELPGAIKKLWDERKKKQTDGVESVLEPTSDDPELSRSETASAWGPLPQPDALGCFTPPIDTSHGYALFSPTPRSTKDHTPVWRVSKPLGYGKPAFPTYQPNAACPPVSAVPLSSHPQPSKPPDVICLDDAGGDFRQLTGDATSAWCLPAPASDEVRLQWIVLKLSGDFDNGPLWNALETRKDLHPRLVILVAAQQLRQADVRLSDGLSWERSAEHLLSELLHHPGLARLQLAAHVIVHFGIDGAVWVDRTVPEIPAAHLVFDAANAEGEWAEALQGGAFAYQTCLAAAVCRGLAMHQDAAQPIGPRAISEWLKQGLSSMRHLRSSGHGIVEDKAGNLIPPTGFPVAALAAEIRQSTQKFSHATIPGKVWDALKSGQANTTWTILSEVQNPQQPGQALFGLARQIVLRGEIALECLPHLRIGKLLTTDRADMEALRTLRRLFNAYKSKSNPGKKPLSIGVFGPPGAGKSFGVKQLALGILAPPGAKEYTGWREFNLSQFDGPKDLIGAFHQIRDLVLQGVIPVVFWDEFDSGSYKWLQYLLAPMQDGRFQEGESTHTIGKCIFIFAGGTSWTFDSFGEFTDTDAEDHFRLAKGPDFRSRLDGSYDVTGPNQRLVPPTDPSTGNSLGNTPTVQWLPDPEDIFFPVRRALMIRGFLASNANEPLHLDPGLLTALLQNPRYIHGARSLEKVIEPLISRKNFLAQPLRPVRSALPSPQQLRLHVADPDSFHRLCRTHQPAVFLDEKTIEILAQAIHAYWEVNIRQAEDFNPNNKKWIELKPDTKQSNYAAAHRIPDVLALAGLTLTAGHATQLERTAIETHLSLHLDLLAEEEHNGWMDDRKKQNWTYNETRNDDKRHHPCLKPYTQLPQHEQEKDRSTVLHYPDFAELIGYKIVFVGV
jgi:hypothetical protein